MSEKKTMKLGQTVHVVFKASSPEVTLHGDFTCAYIVFFFVLNTISTGEKDSFQFSSQFGKMSREKEDWEPVSQQHPEKAGGKCI